MHRSDDRGATWTEIASPAYPEGTEATTELLWELVAGHPDEPGALWCGTIPGGLFRSADRGDSWQLNRALWDDPARTVMFGGGYDHPGIHSISIDPRQAGAMTIAISCGGAWSTSDGGASWSVGTGMRADFVPPQRATDPLIQEPHRLVRCAAEPDVQWVQHHCGIYRSMDNARTWTALHPRAPHHFGFAVAAHPGDPLTAWFVPAISDEVRSAPDAAMCVMRTNDGGETWTELRAGLPQEHAYDLVYRHCLDVDDSGARLVISSTTGNVWTSDDGGDSWTKLDASLPPVFCVRFA